MTTNCLPAYPTMDGIVSPDGNVCLDERLKIDERTAEIKGLHSVTKTMAQRIIRRGKTLAEFLENKPTVPRSRRPPRNPSRNRLLN